MRSANLLLVIWLGLVPSLEAFAQDQEAMPKCPDDSPSALAQEQKATQACPNPVGWKPTDEELRRILSDHSSWVEAWESKHFDPAWAAENAKGRANLCNADLQGAELDEAKLRGARLNGADLSGVRLNKADLMCVKLNGANLISAKLNGAI